MRSTPCPNETFRTVNDARTPPRRRLMITPSKIWMRSLSPSLTRTCTRTVSPAFIRGRSISCPFSMTSMAPMLLTPILLFPRARPFQLAQHLLFFLVERRPGDEFGSLVDGALERLPPAPPPNLAVVAGHEHVRHAMAAKLRRSREVRIVEKPSRKRIRF